MINRLSNNQMIGAFTEDKNDRPDVGQHFIVAAKDCLLSALCGLSGER